MLNHDSRAPSFLLLAVAASLGVACADAVDPSPLGVSSNDAGASNPTGSDGGVDANLTPPGDLGSSCDPARPVCNGGAVCRYDLAKGYICQAATSACVQPAQPTGLDVGFIYGNWMLPAAPPGGYAEVTLDMHPIVSGPDDGSLQYFAMGGGFPGGPAGSGFYGGLQTRIGNGTPAGGKRGVIFSGFGIVDAIAESGAYLAIDRENCDGTPGAVCAQLSVAYPWHSGGTYRLKYAFAGAAPGRPDSRLLRTSVTDVDTNVETVLGSLVVPNAWRLPEGFYTFDETFPPGVPETCQNYNPSDIEYTRLRGNGSAAGIVSQGVGPYKGPCLNNFHYRPLVDGYRMLLGICVP